MSTKVTRFANYLRSVIPTNDIDVLRAAVNTMGKLTSYESLASEIVSFEISRALEWLQSDRQESRRHSAVLMIAALARGNKTLIYTYISKIMEALWVGLRDPKVSIRIDAAEALHACLEIMVGRDTNIQLNFYRQVYEEAQTGLRIGTTDDIHGSLLAFRELLRTAGMFMQSYYSEVCETVLRYKDHKDLLVRRTVISIIPDLSQYSPIEFTKKYLSDSMSHLVSQFKKERERALVFLSIGKIALSVRSNIVFYLDPILDNVKEGLTSKGYEY